ncbi:MULTISPECIES: helix-turn-helix transcriptional regulator [unclassified Nocardioides]|jgi:transcriptional regulator with XRE-family HTH domain|uniref:helix-turn-helix transcriptional regulator n=1 Tax=unclassified Nocardioides TaxID=2615069 RepID=UPI0007038EF1|nr:MULTISPECIES: helix-turn-helix transcriptional regulator [unclassified Nocardioides]KRC57752.1 hypothetical protein ASE19_23645 [Nocardioides sp. Root79]KRC74955.1 hypothetical protein ASE20_23605 [Nocardioides sp. Root240]
MGGVFGEALRAALDARSMSLGSLHRSLQARGTRVSLATLSYWRSGQREPEQEGSLRALAEIEQILHLDPGALEVLLEKRRRRVAPNLLADLSEDHERIRTMLADLDFHSPSDRLIDREVTLKYELGPDRAPVRSTYVVVVESIHAHADRRATVLSVRPGAEAPDITPLGGYRLGEVLHDRERGIVVGEMLLDRPLVAGETALLEQDVVYRTPDPDDNCYFYWAVRRMTSVSLWIRFHPDHVPARCEYYTVIDGVEQVTELETFGASVSRTATSFGPGTLGIRWHWD